MELDGEVVTIIAVILAVALVATVICFLRHITTLETGWALERRELINRIQRPEHIPAVAQPDFVQPEFEPDDIGLVGTIAYGEEE